jgi:hypothetical protein
MRKTEGTKLTDAVDASEVSYSNGSITLTATLLIPKGPGPFRAPRHGREPTLAVAKRQSFHLPTSSWTL